MEMMFSNFWPAEKSPENCLRSLHITANSQEHDHHHFSRYIKVEFVSESAEVGFIWDQGHPQQIHHCHHYPHHHYHHHPRNHDVIILLPLLIIFTQGHFSFWTDWIIFSFLLSGQKSRQLICTKLAKKTKQRFDL